MQQVESDHERSTGATGPGESRPETTRRLRGTTRTRGIGALLGLPCWAALVVAALLWPDPRGYDTHTQLYLPPCSFLQRTGLPCPTCGMTTAFACMAHGQIVPALRAQAFGAAAFLLTALGAAAGTVQLLTGRNIVEGLNPRPWWLWALLASALAGWALKLAIGLASGQLPVR